MPTKIIMALFTGGLVLLVSACGGEGGRILLPPGNHVTSYPQHFTTDLDGTWSYVVTNVVIDDPGNLMMSSPAEFKSDLEGNTYSYQNGRDPDTDYSYATMNRVSKLSATRYEIIMTLSNDLDDVGGTITLTNSWNWTGSLSADGSTFSGTGQYQYTFQPSSTETLSATVSFDFVGTKS